MTTEVTQFDVAFTKLNFKRTQNNLEVLDEEKLLTTYESFFNGTEIGTVVSIQTKDTPSGYTTHNLLNEAMIEVDGYAEYQGYNVVQGSDVSGYNEKITVKYDGQQHAPEGQSEGYDSVIYGNYGNDIIYGSNKSDWLQGSQGNDTIYGGSDGEDMISGDMGDDVLIAGSLHSKNKITYNKTGIQLYGADGDDSITGGDGDDFIWGGTGNDVMSGRDGANTFVFVESNFGDDIIKNSSEKDILKFVVNYGSTTPNYSGYNFSDLSFIKSDDNLIITGTYTQGGLTTDNSVTIKNYFKQKSSKRIDTIYALDDNGNPKEYSIKKDGDILITMEHNRIYKGGDGNERVNAENYVSTNGKTGVSITEGAGNDVIVGSVYNDTIKSSGGNNTVSEYGGTNKITLGKGDDTVTVSEYSNNTIKAGKGKNTIYLESYGENKVTSGSGDDTVEFTAGYNRVKAGDGNNTISVLDSSVNTITTGKGNDDFTIEYGNNTIKSGGGVDTFSISGGYNTINTGSGNSIVVISNNSQNDITGGKNIDTYSIESGTNYVNAKSGNDTFTVSGGNNILYGAEGNDTFIVTDGNNTLNGGKGNDIYDFSGFANLLTDDLVKITDTSGKNTINLGGDYTGSDVSIYVNVELNSKKKAKFGGEWNITDRNNTDATVEGISLSGGTKSSTVLNINNKDYTIDKTVLKEIASSVASWLANNNYSSTVEVFESGISTDVTNLISVYNTESAKIFADNS